MASSRRPEFVRHFNSSRMSTMRSELIEGLARVQTNQMIVDLYDGPILNAKQKKENYPTSEEEKDCFWRDLVDILERRINYEDLTGRQRIYDWFLIYLGKFSLTNLVDRLTNVNVSLSRSTREIEKDFLELMHKSPGENSNDPLPKSPEGNPNVTLPKSPEGNPNVTLPKSPEGNPNVPLPKSPEGNPNDPLPKSPGKNSSGASEIEQIIEAFKNVKLTDQILVEIVKNIGKNWKMVAISLGITQATIDKAQESNPNNVNEQILSIFSQWRRKKQFIDGGTVELLEAFKNNPQTGLEWGEIRKISQNEQRP